MSDSIARQIEALSQQLPPSTKLIAVSKTHSIEKIRAAYHAGIRDFAENRLQEALAKQEELADLSDIRWHFIGHLQKNKAKKAIAHFDWIHTIDSLALAQKLNSYAEALGRSPKFCLQVKPLPDPNKFGWDIKQLSRELPELAKCQSLKIQGLMTILPLGLTPDGATAAFKTVYNLQKQLNQNPAFPFELKELSMGMSGDYSQAIEAGSTMIRVGSAIFGQRQ
ncbi:YggS family pyridoxal phosphate-dependent enzyme [[Limnothrix rosea] IAM M-220]|uniref:YggS family pyridoxal phosphate-dependent enzyme n=1 Tax=[Limnothrix rosea] IAM M-220 TaxID=454133 RepID=UPI0009663770|nr:YggS family pyridoxal phosphate-dependent enzyme [[Limnothrix rosea] IAM M-220]OKH16088.1 YggS family pyridoxal phosphate enzyme [[Limnothrix rosea] IAM M-220]